MLFVAFFSRIAQLSHFLTIFAFFFAFENFRFFKPHFLIIPYVNLVPFLHDCRIFKIFAHFCAFFLWPSLHTPHLRMQFDCNTDKIFERWVILSLGGILSFGRCGKAKSAATVPLPGAQPIRSLPFSPGVASHQWRCPALLPSAGQWGRAPLRSGYFERTPPPSPRQALTMPVPVLGVCPTPSPQPREI